ncbi:unnamed protein product, partial [Hapterophycus canaliculatus]
PRLGDIRLVASGLRCAVLLDSCRVPRGAPPLADVLLALQRDHHRHHDHRAAGGCKRGCQCRSCGVACLGLVVLEGSCFLVNRVLLSRRLDESISCELTPALDNASNGEAAGTAAAQPGPTSVRRNRLSPPATGCGGPVDQRRPEEPRGPALLDVRKSQVLPSDRSDLLPKLHDALRSAFGGVVSAAADSAHFKTSTTSTPTPAGVPLVARAEPAPGTEPTEGEGATWIRDWETKEIVLDGERLRGVLGGAGLCGFAGWLLEYPVIYCCPSHVDGTDGDVEVEAEDDAGEGDQVMGNCLAGVPLTVYSLSVDFGDKFADGRRGSHRGSSPSAGATDGSFEAFSFSVPEIFCGPANAGNGEEGAGAHGGVCTAVEPEGRHHQRKGSFHGLVDGFLERLERRIARYRKSGDDGDRVLGVTVSKRTETLDRVAL